ncbi:CRTAC1 family protein [Saccharophagus degradans]|uniref:ASPIC/UnbV n=1 Tax=Saccharophagus degradans (strain 2-40 / ATCC 43961 / DSM 17024) TaxID=203122 RepID=Q21HB8_SACD2|nr:CRTAC1 family protein [Saccharophagus degradans]ABD81911.1 ASPIC/UnbV [Saccharophagus degradans 2-40]
MKKTLVSTACFCFTLGYLTLVSCTAKKQPLTVTPPANASPAVSISTNKNMHTARFTLNQARNIRLDITLISQAHSERISITNHAQILVDNLDIPNTGDNTISAHLGLLPAGEHTLNIFSHHANVKITAITATNYAHTQPVSFKDITQAVELTTNATWKYGGPSIADINNDGYYDFLLSNHHEDLPQLFINKAGEKVEQQALPLQQGDFHGTTLADYNRDGLLDILVARGGGNGTQPTPPILLRNENGSFNNVTNQEGLANIGARGRSVRWLDMDLDGDLDMLLLNARKLENETAPRNIVLENTLISATNTAEHNTFIYRASKVFESVEAERVLVTDFNNDDIPDLITYTPLTFLKGNGDFTFTDVSQQLLPAHLINAPHITGVTELDINNDGKRDYYFARGMVYYEMANHSLEFSPARNRIDLREAGSKGSGHIDFEATGDVTLQDFFHWFRGYKGEFPLYLGEQKHPTTPPETHAVHFTPNLCAGWPSNLDANGWYLGYLGNNQWRFGWQLDGNLFWGLRASIIGATNMTPTKPPQNNNVQDLLLLSTANGYQEIGAQAGIPSGGNHQGVTSGDFNNDGYEDLFVYRFGLLHGRVADWLLLNTGDNRFISTTRHGATSSDDNGHGDMGQAFDFDLDGRLDLLSGSDNPGRWYLYQNTSPTANYLLLRLGNSPSGTDPSGARVKITTPTRTYYRTVGSAGEIHSQSLLNTVHVGLGATQQVTSIHVRWRDGTEQTLGPHAANQRLSVGYTHH